MASIVHGVAGLVGSTPLVELTRLTDGLVAVGRGPRVLVKLEARNPGGSAKDRPAAAMLAAAVAEGRVGPGSLVVESSSGNLGVALAQQCRLAGLRFICVVDPRTNATTRRLIAAYGGQLESVERPDPETGDWLAARLRRVEELLERHPDAWWPNQYANPLNPAAHRDGTVREVLDALGHAPTAMYVATSSTGTLVGAQERLRSEGHRTRLVAVDAQGSVLFGGERGRRRLPGFGAGVVPGLARHATPDAVRRVHDLDAVVGCRLLADREALLVGASGGAVVAAAMGDLADYAAGDTVVLVAHDGGERYLDTVFDDAWVTEHLGCPPERLREVVASAWSPVGEEVGA